MMGRPNTGCELVVLRVADGCSAGKVVRRDEAGKIAVTPFNAGTWFRAEVIRVDDFGAMARVLYALAAMPLCLVISAAPVGAAARGEPTRKFHSAASARPGERPPYEPAARRWIALDKDKLTVGICPRRDPAGAAAAVRLLLPEPFASARCFFQHSTSSGLYGEDGPVSVRLWFWLEMPQHDEPARRWAKTLNRLRGAKLVDPQQLRPVQPRYTAAPRFEGMADPLAGRRIGVLAGNEAPLGFDFAAAAAELEAQLACAVAAAPGGHAAGVRACGAGSRGSRGGRLRAGAAPRSQKAAEAVWLAALKADLGGVDGWREPLFRSARAALFAGIGFDAWAAAVRAVAVTAPRGGRSEAEIGRYLGLGHLGELWGWWESALERDGREAAAALASAGLLGVEGI